MSTSRISIDVTPEQHRQLKALAALRGKSLKDLILDSALGSAAERDAMTELEALIDARIRDYEKNGPVKRTVMQIFEEAKKRSKAKGRAS
jgi:uncharacterized protein (DUF1778 family)